MKKSNVTGLILVALGVIAVIATASWLMLSGRPNLIQGEANATSYKASSKIPGRIEQMLVKEGQTVKKGELLYILSTPEIDAKLRQARAARLAAEAQNRKAIKGAQQQQIDASMSMWQKAQAGLALAQKSFDRIQNLHREGVVPAQKFDEAKANLDAMKATEAAAKAQYELALEGTRKEDRSAADALVQQAEGVVSEVEIAQSDAMIYSPVDGEIATVIAEPGELVGAGYPVISIIDLSDMWVDFNLKETLLPKIKMGTLFTGHIPALDTDAEFEVYYIARQADFATWSATRTSGGFDIRTFNVRVRPVKPIEGFRPGMSVIVDWNKIR